MSELGSPDAEGVGVTTCWKWNVVPPPGGTSSTRVNRLASTRVSSCMAARVATSWASETPPVELMTSRTVSLEYCSVRRPKSRLWALIAGPTATAKFSLFLLWIGFSENGVTQRVLVLLGKFLGE